MSFNTVKSFSLASELDRLISVLSGLFISAFFLMIFEIPLGNATPSSTPMSFKVVDVQRPVTRNGKTLTSPRDIYLLATRQPSPQEARRLSRSELQALRRGKKSRETLDTWEGRVLRVFRLGPAEPKEYPTAQHLEYFDRLRSREAQMIQEATEQLAALSAEGSPIALSTPDAPAELLETSDDDDELDGKEEGQICGHVGEQCCETTRGGACDTGLICIKEECQLPPPPCGGFEQACCAEGDPCRRPELTGLTCLEDRGEPLCLFPVPPPEHMKTPVGVLEIISVHGPIVKARVRFDALKPQQGEQPLNAIKVGDEASWY